MPRPFASSTLPLATASSLLLVLATSACGLQAESPASGNAPSGRHDDPALVWGPCPEFLPEGCAIAVLQGDPTEPNADIFFKVPGGSDIAAHWHTSAERMVLVSGRLTVDYAGQPPLTLTPGSYAYGPARAVHSARCAAGADCVLFIAFEGPVDAIAGTPEAQ